MERIISQDRVDRVGRVPPLTSPRRRLSVDSMETLSRVPGIPLRLLKPISTPAFPMELQMNYLFASPNNYQNQWGKNHSQDALFRKGRGGLDSPSFPHTHPDIHSQPTSLSIFIITSYRGGRGLMFPTSFGSLFIPASPIF